MCLNLFSLKEKVNECLEFSCTVVTFSRTTRRNKKNGFLVFTNEELDEVKSFSVSYGTHTSMQIEFHREKCAGKKTSETSQCSLKKERFSFRGYERKTTSLLQELLLSLLD